MKIFFVKNQEFLFHILLQFSHLIKQKLTIQNIASPKLLALGRKNKRVCFVLLSFFRNFAAKYRYLCQI